MMMGRSPFVRCWGFVDHGEILSMAMVTVILGWTSS